MTSATARAQEARIMVQCGLRILGPHHPAAELLRAAVAALGGVPRPDGTAEPHEALRPLSDRERAIWRDGHQAGVIHANRIATEEAGR